MADEPARRTYKLELFIGGVMLHSTTFESPNMDHATIQAIDWANGIRLECRIEIAAEGLPESYREWRVPVELRAHKGQIDHSKEKDPHAYGG